MKAIEGANLTELAELAERDITEERKNMVLASIKAKHIERNQAEAAVLHAEKALEKAKERVTKIDAFLAAVHEGRWEVIGLKADESQQEKKPEA